MRKFWQAVLMCTALLMAAQLAHAQIQTTATRPTSPSGTATTPAGGGAAPVTPTETREATPTAPKASDTHGDTAKGTASATSPGSTVVVEVDKWRHLDAFTLMMIMVTAIACIVLIYYVFLRKRAD